MGMLEKLYREYAAFHNAFRSSSRLLFAEVGCHFAIQTVLIRRPQKPQDTRVAYAGCRAAQWIGKAKFRLYDALPSNNPDFADVFHLNYRLAYANRWLLTMRGTREIIASSC